VTPPAPRSLVAQYGSGGGIELLEATGRAQVQVVARLELPDAMFVAPAPVAGLFYAVAGSEDSGGSLTALRVTGDRLEVLGTAPTGGAEPCHVAAAPGAVLVANYTGGTVAVFETDADGLPQDGAKLAHPQGRGPDPQRQDGPHPHFVSVPAHGPSGAVLVADLGADRIWRLTGLAGGTPGLEEFARLRPGSGPRHLVREPGRLVVSCELSGEVAILAQDSPARHVASTCLPGDGPVYPGDICFLEDHRYAVANRGRGSVGIILARPGEDPVLERELPLGAGAWPQQTLPAEGSVFVLDRDRGCLEVVEPATGEVALVWEGLDMPMWLTPVGSQTATGSGWRP
jgi:6-phosphogluconolactonase (cycloisomerase 2 family)